MKYTVSKKVHGFRYKDKRYLVGEVVDLDPGDFAPAFLEPVVEEARIHLNAVTPEAQRMFGEAKAPAETPKEHEPAEEKSPAPKANIAASIEELKEEPAPRSRKARTNA